MHDVSVLIIDDDITTIKLIAESLQNEFTFSFAVTGEKGLALAEKLPDVILLDIKLPDIEGFEIIRKLKQNEMTHPIPVLFISSVTDIQNQEKGFELGAVDYVIKPIEIPVLKMRIRTHARIRKQAIALENLVATDSLTSLANRRKFDEVLEQELARSKREKADLSFLLIDVDNFKAFNDNYGHGKGDECLINVARVLRKSILRPGDLVARVGGEEFAIILPDSDKEGAIEVAKRAIQKLTDMHISHAFSDVAEYVTISVGIVTMDSGSSMTPAQLFDRADEALYEVKAKNKNGYKMYG